MMIRLYDFSRKRMPRRFIVNSFIRFTLINFVLAFFSFGYFLIAEFPTFAFACLRFHIFTKQMKIFGLSAKRLWICLVAEYLIFVVLCYFLRKQIFINAPEAGFSASGAAIY